MSRFRLLLLRVFNRAMWTEIIDTACRVIGNGGDEAAVAYALKLAFDKDFGPRTAFIYKIATARCSERMSEIGDRK